MDIVKEIALLEKKLALLKEIKAVQDTMKTTITTEEYPESTGTYANRDDIQSSVTYMGKNSDDITYT